MSRLPEQIVTPRLRLRVFRPSDDEALNAAITESFAELHEWMPWAAEPQTVEQTRAFCAAANEEWRNDVRYGVLMVRAQDGEVVGASGYPNLDWAVPKFEIGYWCRTGLVGRGYATEAAAALTRHAFEQHGAARVELRMDTRNRRSWRVAERLGFTLEGVLHAEERDNRGGLRDTRVYARLSAEGLP